MSKPFTHFAGRVPFSPIWASLNSKGTPARAKKVKQKRVESRKPKR